MRATNIKKVSGYSTEIISTKRESGKRIGKVS